MAMSTGAKVAIGCGIAAVVMGGVVIVGLGVGAVWVKGKIDKSGANFTAVANDIDKHRRQANANRFTPPSNGVIDEGRLQKFLEVRKAVYAVYEQHKPEFEKVDARTKGKDQPGLGDVVDMGLTMGRLVADIQVAQYKALASVSMNEEEYRFLQTAVYKTAWAAPIEKETGRQPSELVEEALRQQKGAAGEALEKARQAGVEVEQPSDEDLKKTDAVIDEAAARTKGLEVPRANLELFKKYEADIKKYAMHGLAMVGL
jgi:hypothetical protein